MNFFTAYIRAYTFTVTLHLDVGAIENSKEIIPFRKSEQGNRAVDNDHDIGPRHDAREIKILHKELGKSYDLSSNSIIYICIANY